MNGGGGEGGERGGVKGVCAPCSPRKSVAELYRYLNLTYALIQY